MASMSFGKDIHPLFRDSDVQEMTSVADFDLSRCADVRARAEDIFERLAEGSMPCDQAWSKENVGKFKQWLDEGMPE
jgi:hypothetical protein